MREKHNFFNILLHFIFPKGIIVGVVFGFVFFTFNIQSGQLGPIFPTHHYPTDTSFHLGYRFKLINSKNNFLEDGIVESLKNESTLRIFRHEFTPEYQPNRKLTIGAKLVFDQMKMGSEATDEDIKRSGLGDQSIFTEFRFLDQPGFSLGFGGVVKFPLYGNPGLKELNESKDPSRVLLIGDSQIDVTAMITAEKWFGTVFRIRSNLGYTSRFDGYASEIPYLFSLGTATPKMDIELRIYGSKSVGAGTPNDSDTKQIRSAFGNSDYAYSPNPSLVIVEPNLELWVSAKSAVALSYSYALRGTFAPSYHAFGLGYIYRWAETYTKSPRSYKEVPIFVDQESGKFEGENNKEPEPLIIDSDPTFEN